MSFSRVDLEVRASARGEDPPSPLMRNNFLIKENNTRYALRLETSVLLYQFKAHPDSEPLSISAYWIRELFSGGKESLNFFVEVMST